MNRMEIWRRIEEEVDGFEDGDGKGVDPGIRDLVVALRAHGFPTAMSCEGHPGRWGDGQPGVAIESPDATPAQKVGFNTIWPLEQRLALALVRLLDRFYEGRADLPHHARLAVHRMKGDGWLHLGTIGEYLGYEISQRERFEWHRQGLKEAQDFARFLKTLFLEAGPSQGLEPLVDG